jgi:hypothetical protein
MLPKRLLIIGAVLLAGCSRTVCPPCPTVEAVPETQPIVQRDTIRIPEPYPVTVVDSTVFRKNVLLQRRNDQLHDSLVLVKYKLARINEYRNIINRNPSQVKFIRGWLNRVFQE